MTKILRVKRGDNFEVGYDDADEIVEILRKSGLEAMCGICNDMKTECAFVFARRVIDREELKARVEIATEEAFQQGLKVKRKALRDQLKRELLLEAPIKVKHVAVSTACSEYLDVYGLHKKFLDFCWCVAPVRDNLLKLWEARNRPCDHIVIEGPEWKRTFKGEGNEDQVAEAIREGGRVVKFVAEVEFSLDENGYLVIGCKGDIDFNTVWEDAQAILGEGGR
jgi:hypothetical protein